MLGNNNSNLVLAVMFYQNEDLPVFLLTVLAHGNRWVFGESILEGYILKSFRKNVAFLIHN